MISEVIHKAVAGSKRQQRQLRLLPRCASQRQAVENFVRRAVAAYAEEIAAALPIGVSRQFCRVTRKPCFHYFQAHTIVLQIFQSWPRSFGARSAACGRIQYRQIPH